MIQTEETNCKCGHPVAVHRHMDNSEVGSLRPCDVCECKELKIQEKPTP